MEFSKRLDVFGRGIFDRLADMKKQRIAAGGRVIDFGVGTPNIPPARHIREEISRSCLEPENYVYSIRDTDELHDAVAEWYEVRYGVRLDPGSEVCSLLGSQEGLAHIAFTLVDEGGVVLVPDPCYPIFADGPRFAGAQIEYMTQRRENGWLIDFNAIDPAAARAARLLIVSYPNNPTAAIAPPKFYEELIAFAKKYDICVLHDNAYSELVFDGRSCGSFLAFEGAKEVGVEFNSLSKTYGLAGARIGFCVGNREVVERLSRLKSNLDYGMFLPLQAAAVRAVTGDQSCVYHTRMEYQRRRDLLCGGLSGCGWEVLPPAATMFVWTAIPKGFSDSTDFCTRLFERTGVIMTPGDAFGPAGRGMVRIALVRNEDEISDALELIRGSGLIC